MSTTEVTTWAVDLAEVGAIYPMVGSEVVLWVVGLALWIIWHVWQLKFENSSYEAQLEKYGTPEGLKEALEGDDGGSAET